MVCKVATTYQLSKLAAIARQRDYNRQIPDELLVKLPEGAIHVCVFFMEHHHRAGHPTLMHYRTVWKLWLGPEEFRDAMLDCDQYLFQHLDTVDSNTIKEQDHGDSDN